MKLISLNRVAAIAIAAFLLGIAGWVSRIPFLEHPPSMSTSPPSARTSVPLEPISVTITGPTNRIVGVPEIQLKGCFVGDILRMECNVTNNGICITNYGNYVLSWSLASASPTNHFGYGHVSLAKGTNFITLHSYFEDGRVLTNLETYILDYASFTNPPTIGILWPPNKSCIAGSTFDLLVKVPDPSIKLYVVISNSVNPILEFNDALMDDTGNAEMKDLPLMNGTNHVIVVAKDAAGNSASTNLEVIPSQIQITLRPISSGQFPGQGATISGWISDPNLIVKVNDHPAAVSTNGQWTAENAFPKHAVTPSPAGLSSFRTGFRRGPRIYFIVSAFRGQTIIATQRFEIDP